MLLVMDFITSSLDHGLLIGAICVDHQKGFDSMPHKRLLLKAETHGIHGKSIGLMVS